MAEHHEVAEEQKGMSDRVVAAFMLSPVFIILFILVMIPVIAPGPR